MTSPSGFGIGRADAVLRGLPGNQGVHAFQEQFLAGLALLSLIFQVSEGGLVHTTSVPVSVGHFYSSYATLPPTCSENSQKYV